MTADEIIKLIEYGHRRGVNEAAQRLRRAAASYAQNRQYDEHNVLIEAANTIEKEPPT